MAEAQGHEAEEGEEDGAEETSESGSKSDSSSSDMHEDELWPSPPRKKPSRNALVEDEDGDTYFAHEVETGPEINVASSSSRHLPAGIRPDPTVIPWAQHIGVDAQKMHVMQTSLFRMPEEVAALKASNQSTTRPRLVIPQPLHRKHSRDSDGEGLRFESREVGRVVPLLLRTHTQSVPGRCHSVRIASFFCA